MINLDEDTDEYKNVVEKCCLVGNFLKENNFNITKSKKNFR